MNNKLEKIIEAQIKKINELENKIQTNHPEAVSVILSIKLKTKRCNIHLYDKPKYSE